MKLPEHFSSVGSSTIRSDGKPKVTGETRYTADYILRGMIWGKCLRSPFAHARIIRIDVDRAKKLNGVLAILTAADLPDRLAGIKMKDMPVLAKDRVRFIGERVAVVGAESPEIAEEALSRMEVEYEELPAVHGLLEAMSPDAPIIHEALRSYEGLRLPLPEISNVHSYVQWQSGDFEKGFSESDFVLEQTFTTQRVHQCYLEPHAAVVQIGSSDRILIWSPAKQAYLNRQNLAEWLSLDQKKIAFQLGSIGGDFGGKNTLMDIPLCYHLAKVTGRPVKMVMSYFDELSAANPRHASVIKTGVKKDGRLWARDFKAASSDHKPLTARGNFNINKRTGAACFFAQAAEVEIDPETGQIKVRKITSAHDVGTIINPITHQGQVDGGMVQGFGFGLTENLVEEGGKLLTTNLGEYKLPNIQDIPRHQTLYIRDNDGPGPFRAKPVGEHGAILTAAAIGNAVYDAIGAQIRDLPITAEKAYIAMRKKIDADHALRTKVNERPRLNQGLVGPLFV